MITRDVRASRMARKRIQQRNTVAGSLRGITGFLYARYTETNSGNYGIGYIASGACHPSPPAALVSLDRGPRLLDRLDRVGLQVHDCWWCFKAELAMTPYEQSIQR